MVEWRSIDGFPGYEVSADGQIRSIDRMVTLPCGQRRTYTGKILSPSYAHGGYPQVNLRRDGVAYPIRVHCAVAETFLGPRPEGQEVRHLDGNPGNARVENLEYGTARQNSADKDRHGTARRRAEHPSAKLSEADVAKIRQMLIAGETHQSIAAKFKVARTNISAIAAGRSWKGETVFVGRAA